MTRIIYQVKSPGQELISGEIFWAASEYFGELTGQTYSLGEMEAVKINQISTLPPVAKLLLSAVAGAIIQRLLDEGVAADLIFSAGTFEVIG